MAKQTNEVAHHHPSTTEIRQKRLALYVRQRALQDEGAAIYAGRGNTPPPPPLTEYGRRVAVHIREMLNGATPQQVLEAPGVLRDQEIKAELDAIRFVDVELGKQYEAALEAEANEWVHENAAQWKALCREIVLAAIKLAALEDRARDLLAAKPPWPVPGLAMGDTIGSTSILGHGDPLLDLRAAALKEGVVTKREIAEASNG